ncbi:hypothetical protein GG344DRAFT_84097 [Lentinula edodes]|nr:hypothetical protein GG344DRAFT_84097 [Lentinula edodes]
MLLYSALSFPFSDRAFFGAGSPPSSSSTSSSPSPSSSSPILLSSSSSSLSTVLLLFFGSRDGPGSGISGGKFLLLAASIINQSNLRLMWRLSPGAR